MNFLNAYRLFFLFCYLGYRDFDLFAPFKRYGNQSGVGLGLFLAKNAADALRAKISLKNRKDGKQGCIAKLVIRNTSHLKNS